MTESSEHTLLMNLFIALSKKDRHFPSYLREIGYDLELIEPIWKSKENIIFNPDLLFINNSDSHLLVIECKCGGLEEKQIEKYKDIKITDIFNANILSINISDMKMDFAISCCDFNYEKIQKHYDIKKIQFPTIIKYVNYLETKYNSFINMRIRDKFATNLTIK